MPQVCHEIFARPPWGHALSRSVSSWIGHALGALTLTLPGWRRDPRLAFVLPLAAIAPDIDLFLQRYEAPGTPRWTHSLFFVALAALAFSALWIALAARGSSWRERARILGVFFVACASHLVFDMLVGVGRYVIFWPFSDLALGLPFGVLPSAPRPSLSNPYLYRNLALEAAIYGGAFLLARRSLRHPLAIFAASAAIIVGVALSAAAIR